MDSCPFCHSGDDRICIANEHAIAFPDTYPVTEGHTLVAPRKHVSTIYELGIPEQRSVRDLVEVRQRLLHDLPAEGFNIGFNDGLAALHTRRVITRRCPAPTP